MKLQNYLKFSVQGIETPFLTPMLKYITKDEKTV